MSALFIGPAEKEALNRLREEANRHPVDIEFVKRTLTDPEAKRRHILQMSRQTLMLLNHAVTFSIEFNHPNGRTARHMSVSTRNALLPNFFTVWALALELGFEGGGIETAEASLKMCDRVWLETLRGHGQAVNVVQIIRQAAEGRA